MMVYRFLFLILMSSLTACEKSHHRYQGYIESEAIYLSSPYNGVLKVLKFNRGQTVNKGDLIFVLDPMPESLKIVEAQAQLLQAKEIYEDLLKPKRAPEIAAIRSEIAQIDARLKIAFLEAERFRQLQQKQAISKHELDKALAQYEELQKARAEQEANLELATQGSRKEQIDAQDAQVRLLTAKLKESKWELEQKTRYAPETGVLYDTYYRVGEFVPSQQPVASLLTPNNIRVEFFIPAQQLNKISVGKIVKVLCEGCKEPVKATVNYISPEAEYIPPLVYSRENYQKLVFRIKANLPGPHALKPGEPVTVEVTDE